MEDQQHKMSTSRCVRWILVGVANRVKEMWISDQPVLLLYYLWQYAPTWAWFLTDVFGRKMVQNFKAGLVGNAHQKHTQTYRLKHTQTYNNATQF